MSNENERIFLDCSVDTDSQFSSMLPLLLMDENKNSTSDSLMLMMMMQSMGTQPINMQQIMPLMLMSDSDDSSDDSLMLMVMLNSMTGGMSTQTGFDSNFNMLLPILMKDCDDADADCKKKQKNMMVMMMAMQSQVILSTRTLNYKLILINFELI